MSDESTAGNWDKKQLRMDDGPDDPLPPESGDEPAWDEQLLVADVAAVDPVAGEVVATEVVLEDPMAGTADPDRDAAWNKGEMAIDDGGEAQPRIDPDTMPESESGPTGGRANPGGGRSFGEVDDAPPEERR